ncbi:hypothetical protein CROQUDRAFT_672352 [Cronartium quercuum f. sp. fusiforme G11]|uniref:Uncharacterized protein n=1 Tax=Cronartium quercuum f. sp. fusiforme G11 TaxID=708437 RepID=A0A9P6NCZ2_9BASI|nr:hypothetical protein CROQUDRAFT_672352 [Cronartium quercuum f. sp. fusiforme G11]
MPTPTKSKSKCQTNQINHNKLSIQNDIIKRSSSLSNQNKKIQPNLTSIPNEIKQKIIYWLNEINENDEWNEDDEIIEEDLKKDEKVSSKILSSWINEDEDKEGSINKKDQKKENYLSLKSVCLVNSTFYELCRPYLWKKLDLEGFTIAKLEEISKEVIPKHSEYIRSIWWRVTFPELNEFEEMFEEEEEKIHLEWGTEKRSKLLFNILNQCKRLIEIDIDLHPLIPNLNSSTHKFIEPISKLTNLTILSLTAPDDNLPFTEEFLIRILKDLNLLESFTCSRISSSSPNILSLNDQSTNFQSPLGLHLSNLPNLKHLDLTNADCIDLSWCKLNWRNSIEKLTLEDCNRISLKVLKEILKLFHNSLKILELDNVPFYEDHQFNVNTMNLLVNDLNDLKNLKYNFNLPNLKHLFLSTYLSIDFLKSFSNCKNLKKLSLDEFNSLTKDELESLLKDKLIWPELDSLEITRQTGFFSEGEIESLEVYCHGIGIEFNVDDDSDDDEDDHDLDDDEEDLDFEFDEDGIYDDHGTDDESDDDGSF